MANLRYDQFAVGSAASTQIILTANPSTGALGKITLGNLVPGINSVLAVGQALTASRAIDLDGNDFIISTGGGNFFGIEPASGFYYLGDRDNVAGRALLLIDDGIHSVTIIAGVNGATNKITLDDFNQTLELKAVNGVTISSLAGAGSRTVVADASGKLSAP